MDEIREPQEIRTDRATQTAEPLTRRNFCLKMGRGALAIGGLQLVSLVPFLAGCKDSAEDDTCTFLCTDSYTSDTGSTSCGDCTLCTVGTRNSDCQLGCIYACINCTDGIDSCTDTCTDSCTDLCTDSCTDSCTDACTDSCTALCTDSCISDIGGSDETACADYCTNCTECTGCIDNCTGCTSGDTGGNDYCNGGCVMRTACNSPNIGGLRSQCVMGTTL